MAFCYMQIVELPSYEEADRLQTGCRLERCLISVGIRLLIFFFFSKFHFDALLTGKMKNFETFKI